MRRHATPAREDKRLWDVVGTKAAVLALVLVGLAPAEAGLAAIVTLTLAYLAQSQAGLTLRARADMARGETTQPEDGAR